MRCSLLALSSYIDTELDQEPAGELEAHLVACDRCRTAIGHLREESGRIAGLARVHVPDDAVHDLFIQIGLIAEDEELPDGPVHRDRPAPVEAPPWFGVERGAALPWAPRPTRHDPSQPRELVGERSPITAVAEPPELLLWDETIDQIPTAAPAPPPVHVVPAPEPVPIPEIEPEMVAPVEPYPIALHSFEPATHAPFEPEPVDHFDRHPVASCEAESSFPEPTFSEPQPPEVMAPEPQPPDLSTSAPMVTPPRLATGPKAFQRVRDAVAVRFALRRRGESEFDSEVEIVSGVGAPRWDQRARSRHWSDSPPIVAAAAPAVIEPPSPPVRRPNPFNRLMARITAAPAVADLDDAVPDEAHLEPDIEADRDVTALDDAKATQSAVGATPPPALADVLSEVASLAAPLERRHAPVANGTYADPSSWMDDTPAEPSLEYRGAGGAPAPADELDTAAVEEDETQFGLRDEAASPPAPGRHVRRLQSNRSGRREWNPTQPVTGRHVLPLGGPAVAAADRDRRLWLFGAVTVVLMVLGLLIGRQVTQTGSPLAATLPRATPTHHATTTTPPTTAPLPVATPALSPIAILPTAPTPQQLTGTKTLGNGASGFSVADVRYGEHPNDFRLVFDMAFPSTVSGDPATVIGYDGATTLYVEFTGVSGASNIATMPLHQVVVSVVALPAVRNSDRLVFKITLTKKAAFDPYYLSGARLVIDIT